MSVVVLELFEVVAVDASDPQRLCDTPTPCSIIGSFLRHESG